MSPRSDALRDLVLSYVPEDEPSVVRRLLTIHIRRAIEHWIENELEAAVLAFVRASLETAIRQTIDQWERDRSANNGDTQ